MRKHTPARLLAYGLSVVAVAALAIAGAASGNHWADYQGAAKDSHELKKGNPDLCPATAGGISFRVDASELNEGGTYPSGNPLVKITGLDKDGGTLSWALLPEAADLYDVAAVVMKGGPDAMVYYYDAGQGGLDDADTGITTPINTEGNVEPRPYGISHVDFCFDPKGGTGVKRLDVEKTADAVWEKVYTWDVEKSVDPSHLEMKTGQTGTANWKVDVTQTGYVARKAVVSGTITVTNPNDEDVTGVTVGDALPEAVVKCEESASDVTVPAKGSIECSYSAPRESIEAGTNTATATGSLDGVDVSDSGTADFTFGDPRIEINKTVKAVDGKNTWDGITGTTSFPYPEQFGCSSTGRTNVVNLLGDNPATPEVETDYVLDTDSATVTVHCSSTPPPNPPVTPPSDEFMDVQVAKDATQQVQLVNGQATISYTIRVRNPGPNQAHNVTLADAAPNGVTFLAITQAPAGAGCSITGGALVQCSLGTIVVGGEKVIGLSARVTQTGTLVNCAMATGDGKDTNGSNNRACASTLVTAPVTPPTPKPKPKPTKPKPKPKPVANVCRVLKVTPGMVKVNGRKHVVVAKVTKSKTPMRGVKVRFTGVGLNKVVKTNKKGVARVGVTPSKSGIMVVRITNVKACNSARIGVVGVFEPPVTG